MLLVDAGPQSRQRDGVVARESPGAPRRGHGDGDGAEEGDDEDQEGQAQAAAGGVHDHAEDVGQGLGDGRC